MPRVIGLMSGSSLDGLDIACVDFSFAHNHWSFAFVQTETVPYSSDWVDRLSTATNLDARSYLLLHTSYGHYLGQCVRTFLDRYQLNNSDIVLISSHGHTVFHEPWNFMTGQIGDGAAIVAESQLTVVSDLRALDVAHGGQGAPIVPIGEKYLFGQYRLLLNLGGIANITDQKYHIAFDICPANRILNKLCREYRNTDYDENGQCASQGEINENLLKELNQFDYYKKIYPKSLSNSFGLDLIYPILKLTNESIENLLRTYVEHIVQQICLSIRMIIEQEKQNENTYENCQILITGGGAHNQFLIEQLRVRLNEQFHIEIANCDVRLIDFKEALIMAFIGLLRLENQPNVLSSVTGAKFDTIGGALWKNN